jgi:hypothetical protein
LFKAWHPNLRAIDRLAMPLAIAPAASLKARSVSVVYDAVPVQNHVAVSAEV